MKTKLLRKLRKKYDYTFEDDLVLLRNKKTQKYFVLELCLLKAYMHTRLDLISWSIYMENDSKKEYNLFQQRFKQSKSEQTF